MVLCAGALAVSASVACTRNKMKIVNKRPKLAPQLAAFSDDTPEQQPDVMSAEAENEAEEAVRALKVCTCLRILHVPACNMDASE